MAVTLRRPNQEKTLVCTDCNAEFAARMASAKQCPDCRLRERVAHLAEYRAIKPRVSSDRVLTCQGCGNGFQASRSDAKWCHPCQVRRAVEHGARPRPERAPAGTAKNCTECGKAFTGTRRTVFCDACRTEHHRAATRRADAKSNYALCPKCGRQKRKNSKVCRACNSPSNLPDFVRRGPDHPNWKGGRWKDARGYWHVAIEVSSGFWETFLEHVHMWQTLVGPIPKGYHIHHVNGDRGDNRIENFECISARAHAKMHADAEGLRSKKIQHHESRATELELENERLRARIRELEAPPNQSVLASPA